MRPYGLLITVLLAAGPLAGPSPAASWADGLFEELSRDFGSVPRGQMVTHPFRIVNNTRHTVRIAGVRVSCTACTTAKALQTTLAPGQETAVVVQMDTRRFSNGKSVTVYVTFDQPRFEEVRLWIQANSRDDVAVQPDGLAFGRIKRGTSPTASVTVSFLGSPFVPSSHVAGANWGIRVEEVRCESNYIRPACKLIRQESGEVSYQLTATLRPDAPPGKWFTDIWLKTNSPSMPRVRVPVTLEIESALSLSPNSVALGEVKAGTETDRKVVIRGVRPFRIIGISGTDDQVSVRDSSPESQRVHVLTVTLRPTGRGDLNRTIRVHTDLKTGGDIEFNAQAQVVP
jgi:hypothetical protein